MFVTHIPQFSISVYIPVFKILEELQSPVGYMVFHKCPFILLFFDSDTAFDGETYSFEKNPEHQNRCFDTILSLRGLLRCSVCTPGVNKPKDLILGQT